MSAEQPHCHLAFPLAGLALLSGAGISFLPVGNLAVTEANVWSTSFPFIFLIDFLTDTNKVLWVENLLEDILLGLATGLIEFMVHVKFGKLTFLGIFVVNIYQMHKSAVALRLLLLYLVFSANLA